MMIFIMGNAAVHEVKPHAEHELDIALKIVEGLLQLLYIFPKQAEDLFSD